MLHADIRVESFPDRRSSKCKVLETAASLGWSEPRAGQRGSSAMSKGERRLRGYTVSQAVEDLA